MEAYWLKIPPEPPPNGNIRPYCAGFNDNNKQNEQQNDELTIRRFLTKMTHDTNCLCKKIDWYMRDRQIEHKKELLKYEKE